MILDFVCYCMAKILTLWYLINFERQGVSQSVQFDSDTSS